MNTKKSLVFVSLLVAASVALVACGGAGDAEPAVEAPAVEEEAVEEPVAEEEPMAEEEAMEEETMEEEMMSIVEIAASNEDFSTLVAAVEAAGLAETLAGEEEFTVFAPTDEAFAAALEALGISAEELLASESLSSILLYHVVPGKLLAEDVLSENLLVTAEGNFALAYAGEEGAFINDAQIVATDIEASNGVIHVIDAVILPPSYESAAEQSIVDIAVADGRFGTLVTAVTEAGLAETLAGEGPFTVFAPTDEAFAAAFEGLGISAEELLADKELLTDILLYHVALDGQKAEMVTGRESLPMLNGDLAGIELRDGGAFIAGSQIVVTDIEASNGVIHVIDAVMVPPAS